MFTLWLGDFRTKQFQQDGVVESKYIIDDYAEYSWFNNNAIKQLPLIVLDHANIVIMLGFIDCLYSCVFDTLNINNIASNYVKTINSLVEQYTTSNIYVCSVNPISADYPFAEYSDGLIPKALLSKKIESFNTKIKTSKAKYIDSYSYLINTSFNTIDSVRFDIDTSTAIQSYIASHLAGGVSFLNFKPRTEAPLVEDDTFAYWANTNSGGQNPYPVKNLVDGYKNVGSTLPNNTAYAWGRFYEILGEAPKLSQANAEYWYTATADGYKRGQTPALGAVMCWQQGTMGGEGTGHVAIVEKINSDGSIETSESDTAWGSTKVFDTFSREKGDDGNWGMSSAYTFQGFIYNPVITPTATIGKADKSSVVSKNAYLTKAEMENNARYIWNYLGSKGWSLNAVAGILGNMEHESTISPGRWEGGKGPGFGLVQWTPSTNLTNWCDAQTPKLAHDDIDSQLERIIWEKDNGEQYYKNHYKYTFEDFSISLDDPYTLACAFAFDYERSAVVLWGADTKDKAATLTEAEKEANREALRKKRGEAAKEWYRFLAPYAPSASMSTSIEEKFILDSFKIDKLSGTEIKASFITKNCKSGRYRVLSSSNKELINSKVNIDENTDKLQVVTFKYEKLLPDTSYKLVIEVDSNLGGDTKIKTITFTTPQDYPNSIKSIKLTNKSALNSVDSTFKLQINKPEYIGYWDKNACGYDKQLFINNKCVKTKTVNSIKNITETFTIKKEFDYECKTGDIIQVGIRVWVTDDSGKKIYDSSKAKTSEPICLLNNTVRAYLKID